MRLTQEAFTHPQSQRRVPYDNRRRCFPALTRDGCAFRGRCAKACGQLLARLKHRARVISGSVHVVRGNECQDEGTEMIVLCLRRELERDFQVLPMSRCQSTGKEVLSSVDVLRLQDLVRKACLKHPSDRLQSPTHPTTHLDDLRPSPLEVIVIGIIQPLLVRV